MMAVQLLKHYGFRVSVTASAANADEMKALGCGCRISYCVRLGCRCDEVHDYRDTTLFARLAEV